MDVSDTLLRRAQAGDSEALHALIQPYWETLFRLAYRMTGHTEDAEDLAQEALVRIIRRLPTFRGECAFGTWVYRVALNVCLSAKRKQRPSVELEALPLQDPSKGPEARMLERCFQERIRDEILQLHPGYREVLLLRLIEEMPYAEVADVLQISVKTAQLRFHRGMKRLKERVRPWMSEEERR
jgi:RNA polymerase sigma-70 factor (ECF subfamily)